MKPNNTSDVLYHAVPASQLHLGRTHLNKSVYLVNSLQSSIVNMLRRMYMYSQKYAHKFFDTIFCTSGQILSKALGYLFGEKSCQRICAHNL